MSSRARINHQPTNNMPDQTNHSPASAETPCSAFSLTGEQVEILKHANKNARYCGGGKDMDDLVSRGLMRYIGTAAWCPDPFYDITSAGIAFLRQQNMLLNETCQD